MFSSKDIDLNTEYRNRQMNKAARRQLAQELQELQDSAEKTQHSLLARGKTLVFSIFLVFIGVLLFVFSAPTQAQQPFNSLDVGSNSGENLGVDMVLTLMALQSGANEIALEWIDDVITRAPHLASAYTLRSAVHVAMGDHEQALIDAEIALSLDEDESAAHFFMGQAAFSQARYQAARTHYKAYLTATETSHPAALVTYLHGDSASALVTDLIAACDHYILATNG